MPVVKALRQADIFFELSSTQLGLVAAVCAEQSYRAGEIVFDENSTGSELFVIAEGEVAIQIDPALITREAGGEPVTITTLRRGQSFGEIALVDEGHRSARALCLQDDTRLIIVPRDRLMLLCGAYPDLGFRLMRNLAADLAMKIRNTDMQIREYIIWSRTS